MSTGLDEERDDVEVAEGEVAEGESAEEESAEEKYRLTLDVEITEAGPCRKHVRVTVPRTDLDHFYDEELKELAESAAVPGFRKGHVPERLIERRFRKEIGDQIKQKVLFQSLEQVSTDHKLDPINEPDLDVKAIDLPEEGDFHYEFDIEVRPSFELPDYKGMSIDRPVRDVTDEDVDWAQARYLERFGTLEDTGAPAKPGDWLELSGSFVFDGRTISQFPRSQVQIKPKLQLQDATLDGFDRLFSGAVPGDVREADLVVATEAANVELRGETVHGAFTVHAVQSKSVPELNSAFFARVGVESLDELRAEFRQFLERRMKFDQRQSARSQVLRRITASADWELPEETVRRQVENALRREILEMQQSGFSLREIQARENELRQKAVSTTRQALKEHFVLDRIATEEKIKVDADDIELEIRQMAFQSGESPRRVRARLVRTGMIDNLFAQIRERKAIERILEHADYNDVPQPARRESDTESLPFAVCGQAVEPVAESADED